MLLGSGCTTTRTVVAPPPSSRAAALPSGLRVRILDPMIVHEQTANEATLTVRDPALAASLVQKASAAIERSGCMIVRGTDSTPSADAPHPTVAELSAKSDQLLRGFVPDEVQTLLQAFAASHPGEVVLVLTVKSKIGPNGSWDPMSGAITSAMKSTLFRAAIIDPATARVLWQNEAYLRDLPTLASKDYEHATAILFNTTPLQP
jgi:hypothetical protein